ncbi:Alpha/Beta hydrolase protein [Cercophora scortea]|uniref:Alpha/Beta hydrolase protein n=1 Tax=Cercophora scortea TaxID=314031 RepID=A0AAE0I353_9PEZI|nr:Alpha/Beta hydrolase protein [Cercophora scortea]
MASPTEKPLILLAHGAFHRPRLYDPLKNALAAQGYEMLAPDQPSLGAGKSGITWKADVDALLEAVEPFFEQDRRVLIVGHSYGGLLVCSAAHGNAVQERKAAGKKGGFVGVVFLCAFSLPQGGMSLLDLLPGREWLYWQKVIELEGGGAQLMVNEHAKDVFYNDFPSDAMVKEYVEALEPQSIEAFTTPLDFVASDTTLPKHYILCDRDAGILPSVQLLVAEQIGSKVVRVDGGHSAYASIPGKVTDVLVEIMTQATRV